MIYNVFISHSWAYDEHYKELVNMLNLHLFIRDYSVPKDDPIHNAKNTAQLKEAIKNQMQRTSCVIILAGVYATYSKWINIEIDLAKSLRKKIIAVKPKGSVNTSEVVKDAADIIVEWDCDAIVSAIQDLCTSVEHELLMKGVCGISSASTAIDSAYKNFYGTPNFSLSDDLGKLLSGGNLESNVNRRVSGLLESDLSQCLGGMSNAQMKDESTHKSIYGIPVNSQKIKTPSSR